MMPLVCPLCRSALPPVDDVCPRDGHTGRPVEWLPVPADLTQRFTVLEPFAQGTGGSLYLVDEPETGRRGLLKLLPPAEPTERQRLRRELVKQATLPRTSLSVPWASGESDGQAWLFREWLDGVSLDVRLSRDGALQQTEALAIAAQIATALDELHRGGLLHRDVKPGHIFLQPTPHGIPRALLLDAGVASPLFTQGPAMIYGSPGYIAPEQLLGQLVSFRSDLYSLGCVLYRMLTGRPAFAGESLEQTLAAQQRGELPPTPADLPNGIGALLQSILAKDPQQRPFSAQKLRRILDPFLPDGALMEKQPTSTFEAVPTPSPSVAPQASGTLKPPPPPAVRPSPSMPAPPTGLVKPRALSAPPPPPRAPLPQENTQQIDLAQIEEVRQAKRSQPPPTPAAAKSSPPPVPQPQPVNDRTQPIRLDQILAVADARKTASAPEPPKPESKAPEAEAAPAAVAHAGPPVEDEEPELIEEEQTGVFQPRHLSGAPKVVSSAPPPPPQLFTSQDEPFATAGTLPALRSSALFGAQEEAKPRTKTQSYAPAGPAFSAKNTLRAPGGPASMPPPSEPPAVMQEAAAVMSGTLMGIGGDPLETSSTFQAAAADSTVVDPVRSEREHETERVPLDRRGAVDSTSDSHNYGASAASLPAGPASTGQQRDSRRLLIYASAAVVGLGVLSVGTSLLRGKPEQPVATVQNVAPAAPEAPVAVATAAAAPAAPSQAPRPTIQSLAPSTTSLSPSAAPKAEPVVAAPASAAPAPTATPIVPAEPSLAPEPKLAPPEEVASADKHDSDGTPRAKTHSSRHEARERARSAKSSPAENNGDKASQFAAAREEAREAYAAKNYKAAAAAYERASKFDPTHAGTFAGLGAARLQTGDGKGAVAAYQRAVKLSPDSSGFHAALGRAYLATGDRSKALSEYKRALSLDPNNEAAKLAISQI